MIFSDLINYIVTRHKGTLLTLILLLTLVSETFSILCKGTTLTSRSTHRNSTLLSAVYNDGVISNRHDGLTGRWNDLQIPNAVIVIIIVVDSSLHVRL